MSSRKARHVNLKEKHHNHRGSEVAAAAGAAIATEGSGEKAVGPTSQHKHVEFAAYLEEVGFIQAMTQVVVELYEEPVKPADPIEYFLNRITTNVPLKESLKAVKEQVAYFEKELTDLMNDNQMLREKLLRHEKIPEPIQVEAELETEEEEEDEHHQESHENRPEPETESEIPVK